MFPLLPLPPSVIATAGAVALSALAVTLYDPRLWRSRWFRYTSAAAFAPAALGLGLWHFGSLPLAGLGVRLVWTTLPVLGLVAVTALVVAVIRRALEWLGRLGPRRGEKSARAGARREFLRSAAGLLPLGAGLVGASAMSRNDPTQIVHVPLTFADLPEALHGLRILQLSDLHLGASRTANDLREVLEALRSNPPDLIVLTGDVADHLGELEKGLALVTAFAPRLGVYAALGNHEYLNDIRQTLPIYEQSPVTLLVNQTASVPVGDASLFIAGVDDPVFIGPPRGFFEKAIAACAESAPRNDSFRLLLCHRPEGFEAAARHGFHLTLSGHTHGAQVGIFGRSIVEVLFGIPYWWGKYQRGQSRLYTTSGFGHWFPFRLNCPAEAPIIELRRA
ncbi:MAG: metallophosphoesterase [Myxococcota bacterium]